MWRRYTRFFGADPAADVDDELRFHLETKTEELIAQGWRPREAHEEAERQFGDLRMIRNVGATRAQIEERVLLNLPDRRAVRALHVVRIDLQLRLRIDLRIVVQQQVAIRLLGTCLLRVLVDQNPP